MSVLSLRGVRKRFGATVALDGVDLEIAAGEIVGLVGENGAGKSTLLKIVEGLLRADAGTRIASATRIAHIRQELSLCPHLSVAENIFLGREPSRGWLIDTDAMDTRSRGLLEEFGRPEVDSRAIVETLPMATRQVVEIARALASDAGLILMDEPTSSLERRDVERLFVAIRSLAARGVAVIYVSHFLEEVRDIAQRAIVLRDGRSVWSGPLESIDDAGLIRHMVGREMSEPPRAEARRSEAAPALRIDGVRGSNLEMMRGSILGIAGLI
jgi:ribose transport system ATP-binding protein